MADYQKTNWQNKPSTSTPINQANLNHMEQGIYDAQHTADQAAAGVAELQGLNFAPIPVSTAAGMTDHNKIYVYLGSETGYVSNHWYYWNGSAWTEGGVYNSTALVTDPDLETAGMAADAKAAGDAIADLRNNIKNKSYLFTNDFVERNNDTTNMFDKYNVTYGGVLLNNTGEYYAENSYCYSDYIAVNASSNYAISNYPAHVCYYDYTKTYISGAIVNTSNARILLTPATAAYVRISCLIADLPTFQLQSGNQITPYVPYYVNDVSALDFELYDLVRNYSEINLFNPYGATDGGVKYSANGNFVASAVHFYSDYIEISPNVTYQFGQLDQSSAFNMHICFFDEDKTFISGQSNSTSAVVALQSPADAKYVVFSGLIAYKDSTIVYRRNNASYVINSTDFQPYYIQKNFNTNRFSGKKFYFVGDSITFGVGVSDYVNQSDLLLNSYVNKFKGITGCEVTNLAISGATITSRSGYPSFVGNEFYQIQSDADYVVIFGGTNDYWSQIPLGNETDTTTYTFYGAMNYIFENVPASAPNAKMIFIMPYQQWRTDITIDGYAKDADNGYGSDRSYGVGDLKTYRDIMIAYCQKYGIPYLDLYSMMQSPMLPAYRGMYTDIGDVHPNNNGHTAIAYLLYNFMISNIV